MGFSISTGRFSWWDPEGGHWVRFVVTRVPVSPEKPHGIDYSGRMASGWSDLITRIQWSGRSVAGRKTIATGCGQ